MKKLESKNGITLIVLVVTIIVLLILAGVSITIIGGDEGIIQKASTAKMKNTIESDKNDISMAIAEYDIEKYIDTSLTLVQFLNDKSCFSYAKYDEINDSTVVTMEESGYSYLVHNDGTIEILSGLSLNCLDLELELKTQSTTTFLLKATLHEIEGNVTWSNSDDTVITLSDNEGTSTTITALNSGTSIITATCGNTTQTCTVTVLEVGQYVEYDIEYTDMFTGNEFVANTGWRYLGKNEDGNKLIVSTGIPGILYYYYNQNEGRETNGWWGTDEEVAEFYGEEYTINGYDYDNGGYSNRYAAVGLLKYFENIPYTQSTQKPTIANSMTGTVVGNGANGPLGATLGTAFRSDNLNSKIVDVHNLNLEELNYAMERDLTSVTRIDADATGLFYMPALNDYGYNSDSTVYYWISDPTGTTSGMRFVNIYKINGYGGANFIGVRTVITFSSDTQFLDEDGDGILEIN